MGWWPGHTHLAAGHSSFLAASHSGVASVRAEVTTLLAVLGQPFRLYAEQSYQLPPYSWQLQASARAAGCPTLPGYPPLSG